MSKVVLDKLSGTYEPVVGRRLHGYFDKLLPNLAIAVDEREGMMLEWHLPTLKMMGGAALGSATVVQEEAGVRRRMPAVLEIASARNPQGRIVVPGAVAEMLDMVANPKITNRSVRTQLRAQSISDGSFHIVAALSADRMTGRLLADEADDVHCTLRPNNVADEDHSFSPFETVIARGVLPAGEEIHPIFNRLNNLVLSRDRVGLIDPLEVLPELVSPSWEIVSR